MIKKLYKKGLSTLLTLCLLFSFLPVMPVQAASYTVTPQYCTVGGSSEPREYAVGDTVTVETEERIGATFRDWMSTPPGINFERTGAYEATFVMPAHNITIIADFYTPQPATEYTVTVKGGTADKNKCGEDEEVKVTADKPAEGCRFTKWTTESKGVNFEDPSKPETSFMMPAHDVNVTAEFEPIPAPVPTYPVTVDGGTADKAAYAAGETVKITAPDELAGGRFDNWSTDSKDVTFADAKAATTTFTMPASAVMVKANFKTAPVPPAAEYTVTVTNDGNGTAKAAPDKAQAGTKIILSATPKSGYHFKEWKVEKGGVTIAKDNTFTMPVGDVTVKAVFEKTTTNPITGLPMSGGETGAFALITLSVLLLGITVLKRKADR